MTISDAVSKRILNLCQSYNLSVNKLATISCLTQSTVQSLVNGDSNNPKLLTISRICYGLNISLSEFFSDELFNDIYLNI